MAKLADRALPFLAARGLRRPDAALYLGLSATKFDTMVRDGRLPKPRRIDGCVIWDRIELDLAFDALLDAQSQAEDNPWD